MNRLPLAVLLAGLTSAIVSGAPDLTVGVAGGLVFGTIAVLARRGPLHGLAGAAAGLAMAGIAHPLALSPANWTLLIVGLALGGAWRKQSAERPWLPYVGTGLVLTGICLMLGRQGLLWALPLAGGVAGSQWDPPLPLRPLQGLVAAGIVVGAGLTLNAGFVQVVNTTDRALLAEWSEGSRLVPAGGSDAWWTQGEQVVFRAVPGGPSFVYLPPGTAKRSAPTSPADRAEVGQVVPCDELLPRALEGEERYQVALVRQGCEAPVRWLTPGAIAARALAGQADGALVPLLETSVELPLDEVEATILAAQARLGIVEKPAQVMVEGSPYDQAVLLAHLEPHGAGMLRSHFERLDEEAPGMYQGTLRALSVSPGSGVE